MFHKYKISYWLESGISNRASFGESVLPLMWVAPNENGKDFGSSRCWLVFQLEPDFLRDCKLRNAFKSWLPPAFPFKSRRQFLVQTKHSHCFRSFSHQVELTTKYLKTGQMNWLSLWVWEMFGIFRGRPNVTGQIQRHIGVACWLVNLQCFGPSVKVPTTIHVCHCWQFGSWKTLLACFFLKSARIQNSTCQKIRQHF